MSAKPTGHAVKCGCYSCGEYRRDNARRIKHRRRWAERYIKDMLDRWSDGRIRS